MFCRSTDHNWCKWSLGIASLPRHRRPPLSWVCWLLKVFDLTCGMNYQLCNSYIPVLKVGVLDKQKLPFLHFCKMVNWILQKVSDVVFHCQQRCVLAVDSDIGYRYPNWAEEDVMDRKLKFQILPVEVVFNVVVVGVEAVETWSEGDCMHSFYSS